MTEQTLLTPPEPKADPDRRRPGRSDVSLALIPLLREPIHSPAHDEIANSDPLKAARGILAAVLLSAPLWALIILLARLAF